MVLAEPDVLVPTQIIDAEIEVLADAPKPLRSRQRVRVHIGTAEALARVQILNDTGEIAPGETDLAQIRLETPVVAVPGERFIIRSYSPQHTIAGGRVIDTFAAQASPKRPCGSSKAADEPFRGVWRSGCDRTRSGNGRR